MFEVMNHNPHRGFEERDLTSEKASEHSDEVAGLPQESR